MFGSYKSPERKRDIRFDKGLPDSGPLVSNCYLASHPGVNWSLCRSGILYKVQGDGRCPRRSVHAGGHHCVAVSTLYVKSKASSKCPYFIYRQKRFVLAMYGRNSVSCLSIGWFDVFWLCIGTSGGISLSVNLLRREVAGISGRFVAHRLEAGQILPSGIRLFLQASNLHEACLHPGTIH